MKFFLIFLSIVFMAFSIEAQTVKFNEDFETLPLSVTSSGSSTWSRSNVLFASGNYSDSASIISAGDTAILTTNAIDISGYTNVRLSFEQICKIEHFDGGYIEVSTNNGSTWTRLVGTMYLGVGQFVNIGNKFSSTSYISAWDAVNNTAVPMNNWWKHENFDLNYFAGNYTQFKIRFVLADGNNNGSLGNYGWLLDDIKLIVSNSELNPPMISLPQPMLIDSVGNTGPYTVKAQITDASGVDTALLAYTVNGVSDTIGMINYSGDLFSADIPSYTIGTSICYNVIAIDASANSNTSSTGCISFFSYSEPLIKNIGNGTSTTYRGPFYNGSTTDTKNRSSHISIITANELNGIYGRISKLSFFKTDINGYSSNDAHVAIYLKNTSTTSIPSDSAGFYSLYSNATQVYNSTTDNLPQVMGKIDYNLNYGNFVYDGSSNVMVIVDWYRPSALLQNYIRFQYDYGVGENRVFYGTSFHPSTSTATGNRPNMQLEFTRVPVDYDVAMDSIISPQAVILTGNKPVVIRLRNEGDLDLNKATVGWEVDSVNQPIYIWNGNLQFGLVSSSTNIGYYNFSQGPHKVKIWAYSPNDSTDLQTVNDTISMDVYACTSILNGSYSVGGINADFNTLDDMMDALINCGINGPTTFVLNSGIYNSSLLLTNEIPGLDSINTLTFTSLSGNPSDVVIDAGSDEAAIILDGADFITIKNISLKNESPGSSCAFRAKNIVTDLVIENCILEAKYGNNYNVKTIDMSIGTFKNIYINNNTIKGGYIGMKIYGTTNTSFENIVIEDNTFQGFYNKGLYVYRYPGTKIRNNKLTNDFDPTYTGTISGIYVSYVDSAQIINNEIVITHNGSIAALYLYKATGTITNPSFVYNNIIIAKGTSTSSSYRALYLASSSYIEITNNTCASYSGSSFAEVFYASNNNYNNVTILNNIFANMADGYAVETSNSLPSFTNLDYNNYYSTGSILAKFDGAAVPASGGIAAIKSATSLDTNSLVSDPMMYSDENGRSFSTLLSNSATPISYITTDIDGKPRSATTPSIGASEFTVSSIDAGVLDLLSPYPLDTQSRLTDIAIVIRNFGTAAISSLDVKYTLNNGTPVNYAWTGNLAPAAFDTILIPGFTVPVLAYKLDIYTVLVGDTISFNDSLSYNYYGSPLIDAKAVSFLNPISGCEKTTSEIVSIKIENKGLNDIFNGLTASYKVVGSSNFITENVTDTILVGQTITFDFAQGADMTPGVVDSVYNFIIAVNHVSDPIGNNDTITGNATSMAPLAIPLINDTTINYGDMVILQASSSYDINWYQTDTTSIILAAGDSYTTPMLFDTTSYWLSANSNIPPTMAVIGTQASVYGNWDNTIYSGGGSLGKHQLLYTASELLASGLGAGELESIAFETFATFSGPSISFEIKIAQTSVSNLTNTFEPGTFVTVYNDVFGGVSGWNTHVFTTPFVWDGTSNILIEICATGIGFFAAPLNYTATAFQSTLDVAGMGTNCATTNGILSNKRPNTKFKTTTSLGCTSPRISTTVNVPLPQFDAAVQSFVSPASGCDINQTQVVINIVNQGTDTLVPGYTATYRINNGNFITAETINSTIAPGDTLIFAFATMASLPSGSNGTNYIVTAAINNSADTYSPNDTLISDSILSLYTPVNPIVSNQLVDYSYSAILSGTSNDSLFWYSDSLSSQYLSSSNPYTTAPIYDTTVFWVKAQRKIADSVYQIGNGTTLSGSNGPSPYGVNGYGARHQFIVLAADLKAMGLIQGYIKNVAFDVTLVRGVQMQNYTIRIGSTQYNDLDQILFETAMTRVYGPIGYTEVSGWNTHNFDVPFYWDGESNIIFETSFKNTSTMQFATVNCTNTTYKSTAQRKGNSTIDITNDNILATFNKRPNIRFLQEGRGLCSSDLLPVQVDVLNTPTVDVGLNSIVEPTSIASSIVASPVKVTITNYGTSDLSSATINWSENGVVQTPYSWTGNITNGSTDTITIAAAHSFIGGTTDLVAWSSVSNDTIAINDTVSNTINVCLSGTYTIGANNASYSSVKEAVEDMLLNGICGPVIFNIDSGNYFGNFTISSIAGSSSTNTVTFTSTSGDSSLVNIYGNTSINMNYVVELVNTENIIFKNLTFTAIGSQYGNIFNLIDSNSNISFTNNTFIGTSSSAYNSKASALYSVDQKANNILFENNNVYNCFIGVYLKHTSDGHYENITINNNIFTNFSSKAVSLYRAGAFSIDNNIMKSNISKSLYGVYLYHTINGGNIINNTIKLSTNSSAYGMYINTIGDLTNGFLIANNTISLSLTSSSAYGVYLSSSAYSTLIYNSIHIIGGSQTGTKALYAYNGNNLNIINNIFSTQNGYCADIYNSSAISQLDYNDYYVSSNSLKFARWANTDVADLNALKALDVSKNVHSLSINPEYVSIIDLHSMQIGLYNAGTPSTLILTDMDGETRSTTAPSIGADEFTPASIDLSAYEIVYPQLSGCDYVSNDTIVVKIRNFGLSNINFSSTPAIITVEIDGANPDTISYTINSGTLNSGTEQNYIVTTNYDLSISGKYIINSHVSIANDGNSINDNSNQNTVISYPVISNFPFVEDFESGDNLTFNMETGSESKISITSFAANSSSYGMQMEGGTYSGWNYSTSTIDQALANTSHIAKAFSCNVDATNSNHLSIQFDLKQTAYSASYVSKNAWFRLMLTDANGTHYLSNIDGDTVFQPNSMNNDDFESQIFNLDNYVGQNFSLSFEAINKYKYGYGSADGDNALIDNITIWEPTAIDVGVNSIVQGRNFGMIGDMAYVKVAVENFGIDTLYNIPLSYQVGSGAIISDTLFTTLLPNMRDTFTFVQDFMLTNGSIPVKAFCSYPNDTSLQNDTAVANYKGMITIIPNYSDNFEGVDNWIGQGNYGQWELGVPNATIIDTAHSGINAWVTKLDGNYNIPSVEYLYTPFITIPAYTDTATIEFYQFMRTISGKAYGTLEYSVNNGVVWSAIGYIGIPSSVNWYNAVISGQHVWNNMDNNWAYSSIMLDPAVFNTGNTVQFRFKFVALNSFVAEEGWAIDDFKLYFPSLQTDAGITEIVSPIDSVEVGTSQNITVKIKNFGTDTIFNMDLKYTIGSTIITETYTGVIPADSIVEYTFSQNYTVDANTNNICVATLLGGDMQLVNDQQCKSLVATKAANDAGVSSIHAPFGETTIGAATTVKVYITNYGVDPIISCDVKYTVSGLSAITETFTGNIASGDSAEYIFNTTYTSLTGAYSVCAGTDLLNDGDATNDNTCVQVVGSSINNASGDKFIVIQNQPNPALNNTVVEYFIPKAGKVNMTLVNVLGKTIINNESSIIKGNHQWNIDVRDLNSGIYYYTIRFNDQSYTYKMIIVK